MRGVKSMSIKDMIGNIYYRKNLCGLDVFRVYGEIKRDTLFCKRYYDDAIETYKLNYKYFNSNFNKFSPVGKLAFFVLKNNGIKDIAIAFMRKEDMNSDHIPYAVCRQNMVDHYDLMAKGDPMECKLGCAMSKDTAPNMAVYKSLFSADEVVSCFTVSTYLDDRLSELVSMAPQLELCFILDQLKEYLTKKYERMGYSAPKGLYKTPLQLMMGTDFEAEYYRALKIIPMPISLRIAYKAHELGTLELTILKDITGKIITNNKLVKYSKDIDFSKVTRDYLLLVDINRNLYIVLFDEIYTALPEYAGNHLDILRKFKVV